MKCFRIVCLIGALLCTIAILCACMSSEKKEYSELIIGQWTAVEQSSSQGWHETYQPGDETSVFLPDGTCIDREIVKWWIDGDKLMLLTDDGNYVELEIITLDETSLVVKRNFEGETITGRFERMN